MEIRVESLIEGARRAVGTVVIIDVFRAFTSAAVALSRGAESVILVAEPEDALLMRQVGIGDVCMGEVGGKRPPAFDFGNSPYELSQADLAGKTLIQSTRAGTVGACAAEHAQALYVASLVTVRATAEALRRAAPEVVTLVAMGVGGRVRADEDELCALYLRNLLEGRAPDRECVRTLVLAGAQAIKFGDPAQPQFHPRDRDIALEIDSLDFAIPVTRENGLLIARRA